MSGVIIAPSNICNLTKDEKRALQGTEGTPGELNRYVTHSDTRVAPASDTNSGTMSAEDYTLLHNLSTGDLSTLTDMDMSLLAEMASRVIYDERSSSLNLLNIGKYMNIETYTDGYMCPGSVNTNLSRNGGRLVLSPDANATTITMIDTCESATPAWQVYNPEGINFVYETSYWDLVGKNALKQSMINAGVMADAVYMIISNYRDASVSNVYGLLLTTRVSADNNPLVGGWSNLRSKCVKQDISSELLHEDFFIPFPAAENVTKLTLGIYTMFPAGPMSAWFSDVRACVGAFPVMVSSGVHTTAVCTYDSDVKDLIVVTGVVQGAHQNGAIQTDISLDGGAHWKTAIAVNTFLSQSADLLAPDTGTWDNLKNVRVRCTINRGTFTELGRGLELSGIASIVRTVA